MVEISKGSSQGLHNARGSHKTGFPSVQMKYLSVCSGIEAATVAWHSLGWDPVGFSEIEKFPSSVLAHHYPDVHNYGDMNDFQNWPRADIDVLVGGTPCQSFSVAGLRGGMADPRGNLALVYLAIAERYRPKWLVWENVPGVLSSNEGRDFGSIIGAMVELGYGIAYRVLDAQYFGVPQRRRRVFVVGCFGDWRSAAKVLFEPQSLRRNPPPSREPGQRTAAGLTAGANPNSNAAGRRREDDINLVPDVSKSIRGNSGGIDREDMHTIVPTVAFAQNQRDEVRLMDKAGALSAEPGAKQQTYIFEPPVAFSSKDHGADAGDVSPPLRAMGGVDSNDAGGGNAAVVFEPRYARNGRGAPDTVCPPLKAQSGKTGKGDSAPVLHQNMAVRRLTPLECERLQGFPDGYTDIPGSSDSGRYKALGNSMAVPVMHWIGSRINDVT